MTSHGPVMVNSGHSSHYQVIDGKFLDQRKLISKLREMYGISSLGRNNFRVEVYPFSNAIEINSNGPFVATT